MGHGVFDKYSGRYHRNQQKELDFFDLVWACNWCVVVVLLQSSTTRRRVKVVPVDKLSVVITLILAFVFLHEPFTFKSLVGCVLIGAGTLVMVL